MNESKSVKRLIFDYQTTKLKYVSNATKYLLGFDFEELSIKRFFPSLNISALKKALKLEKLVKIALNNTKETTITAEKVSIGGKSHLSLAVDSINDLILQDDFNHYPAAFLNEDFKVVEVSPSYLKTFTTMKEWYLKPYYQNYLNGYDDDYQTTGSNNKVSEFPQLEEENFVGLNNQSSLYYFIEHDKEINFRFGRNMTGAYNFNVVTPKYRGAETENLSPKERYTYDMYIIPRGTSEESWYDDEYQLPEMETYIESYQGKFYYVYFPSTNPITRELAIVINPETVDKKWGLYDDFTTFD